jgi:hypothetical protein
MSDFKILHIGIGGVTDVTSSLTGMPQNLPEDEAIEMTDWDKWISFWDRLSKAHLSSDGEVKNDI